MEEMMKELKRMGEEGTRVKKGGAAPVFIALALTAAIMAGAYAGLCAWAGSRTVFYPGETIGGVNVGGLTVDQAAQELASALPGKTVTVSTDQKAADEGWPGEAGTASITLAELGYTADQCPGIAQRHFEEQQAAPFLSRGARVLSILTDSGEDNLTAQDRDEEIFQRGVARLAGELAREPVSGAYAVEDDEILLTKEANGRSIGAQALGAALESAVQAGESEAVVEYTTRPGEPLSIKEVHEAISGEMENAKYDQETGEIIPEKRGASFDTVAAQRALSAAGPGETVSVPADIQEPEVTAAQLKTVLFRDLLGECTTQVSGTAARKTNVRLASAAFTGTVLNSGDIFSYNDVVGQRTVEKGYKPAPAYIQGYTVDEVGGGVCQPSSTLYYACLLANLEITERYAHRYIPSYITRGMDATVSWGGPNYRFTNNTKYPIKIEAKYVDNSLTVQLWGTKTDDLTVKMTYETLSTTPYEEVEQLDPTLAPGTRKVEVTPYTGARVRTYRNIYDGSGELVSSEVEAISDYKSRNRLTLVGPEAAPGEGGVETGVTVPGVPADPVPGETEEPGVPAGAPAEIPAEPDVPEEPPAVVVIPPSEEL